MSLVGASFKRGIGRPQKYKTADERRRARNEQSNGSKKRGKMHAHHVSANHQPEPETLAEMQRAMAAERTLSQIHFGDPLPGRSELDKRKEGHVATDL